MDIQGTRVQGNLAFNTVEPRDPVDLKLNTEILELMCKMLVTDTRTVRRSQLINLSNFINVIDPSVYVHDQNKLKLVSFIKKGLEARLQFNLSDPIMIMTHINGGIVDDTIVDLESFKGLTSAEIHWINEMISESLKYSHVYYEVDKMIDVCTRFKTAEYGTKLNIVREFEGEVNRVQNNFRKSRNEAHTDIMFSLADGAFEDSVYDTYNQLANPRRKLITGMQGLNELLGGGFESGRCYVFFGLPGEGKSTTLLNLIYQLKKCNADYKPKDPTKIPCLVLLTMENTVQESVDRLFGLSTKRNMNMIDFAPNDVIDMMRKEGGLFLNKTSPINIIIKFVPTNSVDTSYLYTLTEDLEDMGYETIGVFQDYIGRIRSTERFSDTRLEYGAVVDEFKTFAEIKDIPVITASQLNRDASKHIDDGRKNNKQDLVRFLGRSNISESMLILNNIDAGYVIAPEITQDGDRYLGIQRIKIRYKAGNMEYVYLPYQKGSIAFEEDLGGVANFKTTLRPKPDGICDNRISPYQTNVICDLSQTLSENDDDNIFGSAYIVSSDSEPIIAACAIDLLPDKMISYYHPVIFNEPKALYHPVIFR